MTAPAPSPPAPGPVARWVLGARPRTLPAAIVPWLVGTALAHPAHPTHGVPGALGTAPWWCAVLALVVALAIQVGTNYANDYSDGVRGTDEARVGPVRLTATGLAAPGAVKRAAFLAFGAAGAAGLVLAWATSWWVLVVGAACLLAGWFYTGGPRPYGYAGLGEVFVFVFFGLVATVGTFYVQTLRPWWGPAWAAGAVLGLLATALLLANNLRDIATDRRSAKRTLAVRLGRGPAGRLYVVCVALPFVAVVVWAALVLSGAVTAHLPGLALIPLAAVPLALPLVATVSGPAEGRELLPVLAGTGRLQLVYGILVAVAVWQVAG